MVNSMVPSEAEVPTLPPKSTLQLPDGFLEKPHVRHALKYITDDEQREKALEVAIAWKKKFAAEKWKPVVAAIEAASKEDSVRSYPHNDDLHHEDAAMPAVERPRAMTAASAPAVPQATLTPTTTRHELVRQHTAIISPSLRRMLAPLAPRTFRWDVITSGPVTPLSPRPSINSFSRWLRPKPAPSVEQYQVLTPVTATYTEPGSPTPLRDVEAREIYDRLKKDIDALARRHCLARFKARSSGDGDFIPATMIKPKDMLQAAETIVDSRRIKLKDFIIKDLPDRLQSRALAETGLRSRYCINNETDLNEQNEWMNHIFVTSVPQVLDADGNKEYEPQPTPLAVSILDEQRAALRISRKQRESSDLETSPTALEAAWAVKILEDAERLAKTEGDDSSSSSDGDGDDDDGYSYGNFLRSIKSEMSTSTSSGALASMVDELSNNDSTSLRSRSNTHGTASSIRTRDFRSPQQSSTSPSEETRWSARLSGSTVSNNSNMNTSSLYPRSDLRVVTEAIDEAATSELSPEDREFRHRGPDLAELGHWAQELKKMEAMRAERERSPTLHRRPLNRGGTLSGSTELQSPTRQMSVDSINTRISPTRTSHSRFSSSSSSSASTSLLKPLPRPSFLKHSPAASLSTLSDSRPTMLDHEYHQRKMSKASTHKRDTSKTSMHDSVRRSQHRRASSTVQALAKSTTKGEEDDWMGELKRMESRERVRQAEEKRRAVGLLRSDTLVEFEDGPGENG